jgi:hypothetical protein
MDLLFDPGRCPGLTISERLRRWPNHKKEAATERIAASLTLSDSLNLRSSPANAARAVLLPVAETFIVSLQESVAVCLLVKSALTEARVVPARGILVKA